jgi:hypothetical protein
MVHEDAALLNRRVTHMTPAALFSRRLHRERNCPHYGNGRGVWSVAGGFDLKIWKKKGRTK